MSQMTFRDYAYSLRKRKTKREEFLDIMNEIILWEEWVDLISVSLTKIARKHLIAFGLFFACIAVM